MDVIGRWFGEGAERGGVGIGLVRDEKDAGGLGEEVCT